MGAAGATPLDGEAVTWWIPILLAVYVWTVLLRARWQMRYQVPKFCQDVKTCQHRHRIVFVQPPRKPMRAVLKHIM